MSANQDFDVILAALAEPGDLNNLTRGQRVRLQGIVDLIVLEDIATVSE